MTPTPEELAAAEARRSEALRRAGARPGGGLGSFSAPAATPAPAAAAPITQAAPAAAPEPPRTLRGNIGRAIAGMPSNAAGLLDADVGAKVVGAARGAVSSLRSGVGRAALPVTLGSSAYDTYNTDTQDISARTGLEGGGFLRDVGVRAAGALQDVGNTLTFGVADRVGNLIAGNGFNRSKGYQTGEVLGRGSEVGDDMPQTANMPGSPRALPTAAGPADDFGREGRRMPMTATGAASIPAGAITRDGNSYSGTDVKFGAGIYNKDGTLRNGGDPNNPKGFGVTSLDTREGFRQNLLELQRNAAERAAQPVGGVGGFSTSDPIDALRAKGDRGPDLSRLPAGRRARLEVQLAQSAANNAVQARGQDIGASTTLRGQDVNASTAAMQDATSRSNNSNNNATTLRGQELELEGRMIPAKLLQQRRALAGRFLQQAGGDPAAAGALAASAGLADVAEDLLKPVSTMQGQAKSSDDLAKAKWDEFRTGFKGQFNQFDKEGQPKMSEALEQKAFALFQRTNPTAFQERDPTKRQKMMDNALADAELMARFEKPTEGGFGSLVPGAISGNKNLLRQDNLPNDQILANGKIGGAIGGLRGALSPNAEKGDRFFDPGDGYNAVNMGDLSARALARLEELQKESQGKLRSK